MKNLKLSLLALTVLLSVLTANAAIHYVKEGGTGNGTSWVDASGDLQAVINAAQNLDKIFIAAGTYTPAEGTSFDFGAKQLFVYGAFAGTETSTTPPAIPDTTTYKTILCSSGDRVIYSNCDNEGFTLQGLRIQGGVTTNNSTGSGFGAGAYLFKATLRYCTVVNNSAFSSGGGIYIKQGWIRNCIVSGNICQAADAAGGGINGNILCGISDCIISNNSAGNGGGVWGKFARGITGSIISNNTCTSSGGGIYQKGLISQNNITNCIIENNTAGNQGGGIYLTQQSNEYIKMIGCTVRGNRVINANSSGGGICTSGNTRIVIKQCVIEGNSSAGNGGGVLLSTALMANCLIVNNTTAATGAGVRMEANTAGTFKSLLYNSTISNNTSTSAQAGAGISMRNAGCEIQNCIVWGNRNSYGASDVNTSGVGICAYSLFSEALTTDDNHNLNSNPLFVDAENGDFRLSSGSPAINAGSRNGISGVSGVDSDFFTHDLDGKARIVGTTVDMGAYEYSGTTGTDLAIDVQRKIWSSGNTLFIQSDKTDVLSVYAASGALYTQQIITEGQTIINDLPAGLYVAGFDNRTYKIIIQ